MVRERETKKGLISRAARGGWGLGIKKGKLVAKSEGWAGADCDLSSLTAGLQIGLSCLGGCSCSSLPPPSPEP